MNEIIKPHSFEDAKRHIQTFSNKTEDDLALSRVSSSEGLFGWFDHKVTGVELNSLTSQIQQYLISFNGLHTEFIKEFGQVYKALESLDGEYIPAILSAVKGAETASNQAKEAQVDIKKTIEAQKKMIKVLEDHKEKLDKLKHLTNIDEIWNDTKALQNDLKKYKADFENAQKQVGRLEESLKAVQKYADSLLDYEHLDDIDDIWERVGQNENSINSIVTKIEDLLAGIESVNRTINNIQNMVDSIQAIEHLLDIDNMWEDIEHSKTDIEKIDKQVSDNSIKLSSVKAEVEDLATYKKKMELIKHIEEVDAMWSDISNLKENVDNVKDVQNDLIEFKENVSSQEHILEIDALWESNEKVHERIEEEIRIRDKEIQELNSIIEEEKQKNQLNDSVMKKRIVIAYAIAGISIGIEAIQIILNILGII